MARNETETRRPNGTNGMGNQSPMPFLEDMPGAMQGMFQASAELQSEFLTLWSHRAQAWLNWPKQMMACKDMADLTEAQGKFLTTMQRHYKEYCDCMMKDRLVTPERVFSPGDKTPPEPQTGRDGNTPDTTHRKAA